MSRAPGLTADSSALIEVVVGIITDPDRRVLIGQRPDGRHMAGAWEFPGGKLNRGESATDGLRRELNEELGIVVEQAEPLLDLNYRYPDRSVRLDVWWVVSYSGRPVPCDGQQLRWVDAAALGKLPMLPADGPIVEAVLERMSSN